MRYNSWWIYWRRLIWNKNGKFLPINLIIGVAVNRQPIGERFFPFRSPRTYFAWWSFSACFAKHPLCAFGGPCWIQIMPTCRPINSQDGLSAITLYSLFVNWAGSGKWSYIRWNVVIRSFSFRFSSIGIFSSGIRFIRVSPRFWLGSAYTLWVFSFSRAIFTNRVPGFARLLGVEKRK